MDLFDQFHLEKIEPKFNFRQILRVKQMRNNWTHCCQPLLSSRAPGRPSGWGPRWRERARVCVRAPDRKEKSGLCSTALEFRFCFSSFSISAEPGLKETVINIFFSYRRQCETGLKNRNFDWCVISVCEHNDDETRSHGLGESRENSEEPGAETLS